MVGLFVRLCLSLFIPLLTIITPNTHTHTRQRRGRPRREAPHRPVEPCGTLVLRLVGRPAIGCCDRKRLTRDSTICTPTQTTGGPTRALLPRRGQSLMMIARRPCQQETRTHLPNATDRLTNPSPFPPTPPHYKPKPRPRASAASTRRTRWRAGLRTASPARAPARQPPLRPPRRRRPPPRATRTGGRSCRPAATLSCRRSAGGRRRCVRACLCACLDTSAYIHRPLPEQNARIGKH